MIFFLSLNTQYRHTDEDSFGISTNFGISTRIQRLQSEPQGGFTIKLFYLERFVYSQMVLPFEGFRAELTHVFSLVTVCELMLCQSAWVVEVFTTYRTLGSIWSRWHRVLTGPSFGPRLDFRSIFRSWKHDNNNNIRCVLVLVTAGQTDKNILELCQSRSGNENKIEFHPFSILPGGLLTTLVFGTKLTKLNSDPSRQNVYQSPVKRVINGLHNPGHGKFPFFNLCVNNQAYLIDVGLVTRGRYTV